MCVFLYAQGQNLYHIVEVNVPALDFNKLECQGDIKM